MDSGIASLIGSLVGTVAAATIAFAVARRERKKQETDFANARLAQERGFVEARATQQRGFAEEWLKRDAALRQERETLTNAIEAELKRVRAVVAKQHEYVWDPVAKHVRPGFARNPLNWATIHTPIWDSVVVHGKVGLLASGDAVKWSRFFGYVRWMNLELFPQHAYFKQEGRFDEFGRFVATAYANLSGEEWNTDDGAPSPLRDSKSDLASATPE